MNELERLRRELEYAKAINESLPLAEKELLRRARAAEVRLGYVRDDQNADATPTERVATSREQ